MDICVRCLGMAVTGLVALALTLKFPVECSVWKVALCLAAMIPAGIDFVLEELVAAYPQSNALRFVTGCIFGAGGGLCLSWWIGAGAWMPTAIFFVFALAMQLAIAFVFRWCGHLEHYIAKYEDAILN